MKTGTVTITIKDKHCANCDHLMVSPGWLKVPHYGKLMRDGVPAQLARAGVRFYGGTYDCGDLCEDCAKAAAGSFTCALCGTVRASDLKHAQWGDPPESVCEPCYEATPAKRWAAFVAGMEQTHRWDFAP